MTLQVCKKCHDTGVNSVVPATRRQADGDLQLPYRIAEPADKRQISERWGKVRAELPIRPGGKNYLSECLGGRAPRADSRISCLGPDLAAVESAKEQTFDAHDPSLADRKRKS